MMGAVVIVEKVPVCRNLEQGVVEKGVRGAGAGIYIQGSDQVVSIPIQMCSGRTRAVHKTWSPLMMRYDQVPAMLHT